MSTPLGAVLAHQGGWDEILLIVGPMAIVVPPTVPPTGRAAAPRREPEEEQEGELDQRGEPSAGVRRRHASL